MIASSLNRPSCKRKKERKKETVIIKVLVDLLKVKNLNKNSAMVETNIYASNHNVFCHLMFLRTYLPTSAVLSVVLSAV